MLFSRNYLSFLTIFVTRPASTQYSTLSVYITCHIPWLFQTGLSNELIQFASFLNQTQKAYDPLSTQSVELQMFKLVSKTGVKELFTKCWHTASHLSHNACNKLFWRTFFLDIEPSEKCNSCFYRWRAAQSPVNHVHWERSYAKPWLQGRDFRFCQCQGPKSAALTSLPLCSTV